MLFYNNYDALNDTKLSKCFMIRLWCMRWLRVDVGRKRRHLYTVCRVWRTTKTALVRLGGVRLCCGAEYYLLLIYEWCTHYEWTDKTRVRTFHLDLAKFFLSCAETVPWMFLLLAALPDILKRIRRINAVTYYVQK